MKSYIAQQQVDLHQAALSMAASLMEAIKNPEAIKNASKELIEANTISASRKDEAEKAIKVIEEAKSVFADMELKRKEFNEYLKLNKLDIDEKLAALQSETVGLSLKQKEHAANVNAHDTAVNLFNKHMNKQTDDMNARLAVLCAKEDMYSNTISEVAKREAKCLAREAALEIELQKVSNKKKKLLELAKED